MPLSSCVRCEKMFNKVQYSICPACMPKEQEDQDRIREVLARHDGLRPEEVAELAEVDFAVVNRMIGDGVLTQHTGAERVVCGMCGAPAISAAKKLCPACLAKLNANISLIRQEVKMEARKPPRIGEHDTARKLFEKKRK